MSETNGYDKGRTNRKGGKKLKKTPLLIITFFWNEMMFRNAKGSSNCWFRHGFDRVTLRPGELPLQPKEADAGPALRRRTLTSTHPCSSPLCLWPALTQRPHH